MKNTIKPATNPAQIRAQKELNKEGILYFEPDSVFSDTDTRVNMIAKVNEFVEKWFGGGCATKHVNILRFIMPLCIDGLKQRDHEDEFNATELEAMKTMIELIEDWNVVAYAEDCCRDAIKNPL